MISMDIYVLWWEYYDHSGCKVERVYIDDDLAQDYLLLVESISDRNWHLDCLTITGPEE